VDLTSENVLAAGKGGTKLFLGPGDREARLQEKQRVLEVPYPWRSWSVRSFQKKCNALKNTSVNETKSKTKMVLQTLQHSFLSLSLKISKKRKKN
jgi:hypothetical protein